MACLHRLHCSTQARDVSGGLVRVDVDGALDVVLDPRARLLLRSVQSVKAHPVDWAEPDVAVDRSMLIAVEVGTRVDRRHDVDGTATPLCLGMYVEASLS